METLHVVLIFYSGISTVYSEGRIPSFLSHIELFSTSTSLKSGFSCFGYHGFQDKQIFEERKYFFEARSPKMTARNISWYHSPNWPFCHGIHWAVAWCPYINNIYITSRKLYMFIICRNIHTYMWNVYIWPSCVYKPHIYDNSVIASRVTLTLMQTHF